MIFGSDRKVWEVGAASGEKERCNHVMTARDIRDFIGDRYRALRYKKAFWVSFALFFLILILSWATTSPREDVPEDVKQTPDLRAVNQKISNADSDLPATRKMEKLIRDFLRKWEIQGASVAIVKDGRLVYARGFGWADAEKGDSMEVSHVLRVASVSKLFTAAAIMKLREEGRLSLSDRVFGPEGILPDSLYGTPKDKRMERITVEHLLRHEAGFSLAAGDPMFYPLDIARKMEVAPPPDKNTMIRFALSRRLGSAPGQRYSYSNLGYLILTEVIERVSGRDYESYVKEVIFRPAGCYDIHLAHNFPEQKYPHEVSYYEPSNAELSLACDGSGRSVFKSRGGNDVRGLLGAGAWVASAVEVARVVSAMDGRNDATPDILKYSSVDYMTRNVRGRMPIGWINTFGKGNWTRSGSFAGTSAMIKRQSDGYTWVFITNTSSWTGSKFPKKIEDLMRRALSTVKAFPQRDMFSPDYVPVSAERRPE